MPRNTTICADCGRHMFDPNDSPFMTAVEVADMAERLQLQECCLRHIGFLPCEKCGKRSLRRYRGRCFDCATQTTGVCAICHEARSIN